VAIALSTVSAQHRASAFVAVLAFSLANASLMRGQPPPLRPGISSQGVKREMADVRPAAEIRIEGLPDWQAVTEDAVWVANGPANAVHRIDASTNHVIARVAVGRDPCSGLVAAFGSVWSPSCGDHTLVRIDASSNQVVATIPVAPAGREGGVTAGAGSVWLISGKGILARIDPAANRVAARIAVPTGSAACLFAEDAVWVTTPASDWLTRVDPRTNRATSHIRVGPRPRFLTAGAGSIWTLDQGDGSVTRVDTRSGNVVAKIAVGVPGDGGDIAFGGERVWVSVLDTPLSEIDPESNHVVRQWTGGGGDAVRFGFGSLWLSNGRDQNVWRIDPHKLN
jgi:YVTN family beta-propeller protein